MTPSAEDIQALANEAEVYWSAFHAQAEADYSLYVDGPNVQIQTSEGEWLDSTNPPTAKAKADSANNHLITNFPSITIDKSAFPAVEKDKADTLEQALQAVFWRATSGKTRDPHRGSGINAASMGMGCIHIAVDFSRMPEEDDYEQREYQWRRKNTFPVQLLSVDPRELYPDPGTDGERWVIRKSKMTVGEVRETFSNWEPPANTQRQYTDFTQVDVMEWWTDDLYYFEVDAVPVQRADPLSGSTEEGDGPWKNPLGFIPYVVFPSGYGADSGKPEHRFMSLLTAARKGGLFRAEARRMTQLDTIIDKMAWGALVGPPIKGELKLGPGSYNEVQLGPDGKLPQIGPIGFVNPPTGIFAELMRIQDAIDRSTIASVLDSAESGSAESALKFVRKTQEALVALTPLRSSMERAWARVFINLVKFFDNPNYFGPDETIFIYGKTPTGPVQAEIGPKLIKGRHVPVFVEIRPALPEDEAVRIQTGLAGLGRGFSLHDFYDKYARFDNPAEAEKRLYKDLIKQQVIASGTVSAYIAAVMTGVANPMQGLQGFMASQQQNGVGASTGGPPGAAEPTPDVRSQHPQVQNAGTTDTMGNLTRLLQARAAQPKV